MRLKPIPPARRVPREPPPPPLQADLDGGVPGELEPVLLDAEPDAAAAAEPPPPASRTELRGLIDNATAERVYGWAWDAGNPTHRLRVELRLAGEVVASVVADGERPDLEKNGIGDGRHAFEFPILPDWYERRTELTVTAFGADGTEFPIAVRIRRRDDAEIATTLQRQVEAALAEQAAMRAEFEALRERAAILPEASAVAAINANQEDLVRKVDGLEVWLTRLDGRVAEAAGPDRDGSGRLDPWQAVLIAVLASAASAALAVAVARWLV